MNNQVYTYKQGDNTRIVLFSSALERFAVIEEVDDLGVLKLPGGSLQDGESPLAGAQRELQEELGDKLQLSNDSFAGQLKTKDGKYDRYIFALVCNPDELMPSNEVAHVHWLKPNEMPETKHKQHILEAVALAQDTLK